ncbi:MAG: acyltransferase family protein [Gammaproteobacteria bacterium]
MSAADRNPAIDLLRVLSIVYIVGYWHLIPYTSWLPGYANHLTEAIKDVALGSFVFSSGLLLARRDVRLELGEFLGFYQRRLVRIYPLYLFALLVFGLAGLASAPVLLKAALLVSMFAPPAPPTLWFIAMIMFFYLLAPLLIWAARRPVRFLSLCAGILFCCLAYHHLVRPMDSRLFLFLPSFAAGIYLQRNVPLHEYLHRQRLYLLVALLPAYWIGLPADNGFDLVVSLLRAPMTLLGAVLCVVYAERLFGHRHSPVILKLSYASFGVYLFHRPVFELVSGSYFPADGLAQAVYLVLVAVPLSFILAYGVQKGYDAVMARLTQG